MTAVLVFDTAAGQLLGPRAHQNDDYFHGPSWVLVADGVGSDPQAREAAHLAVVHYGRLGQDRRAGRFPAALLAAPADVGRALAAAGIRAGTTLAGAVLDDAGRLWVTTVGDSRAVVVRGGEVLVASRPHNSAAERALLTPHLPVPDLASSVVRRSLSWSSADVPDIAVLEARPGDVVVVATDGVDAVVTLDDLRRLASGESPAAVVDALLARVGAATARDNATCAVGRVVEEAP